MIDLMMHFYFSRIKNHPGTIGIRPEKINHLSQAVKGITYSVTLFSVHRFH